MGFQIPNGTLAINLNFSILLSKTKEVYKDRKFISSNKQSSQKKKNIYIYIYIYFANNAKELSK